MSPTEIIQQTWAPYGGSAAGLVAVSAYQARGAGSKACGSCTLARVLLRQAVVTSLAVGLTVLFDMLFV